MAVPNQPTNQNADLEKNEPSPGNQVQQEAVDEKNAFMVRFDTNDPGNPKNFNSYYKAWLTVEMSLLAFAGSVGSAITAPAEQAIAQEMNISLEATVLSVALFVLGSSD